MSKDPYCAKASAGSPAQLETVVVGQGGGLENVVLYISEGLPAAALAEVPTTVPVFDQKNCVYAPHVLAVDAGQKFKVASSDQTAHNIHPNPNPMTGNIPWNPLHWFVIRCGDSDLTVYRWNSETANAAGARHYCGEAHAEVYISRWFDSVCAPPKPSFK